MPVELEPLLEDLAAEHQDLESAVAGLSREEWASATPAEGWTVADQIAHLAFFDSKARMATEDPARFEAELRAAAADPDAYVQESIAFARNHPGIEVLENWRAERDRMLAVLCGVDPSSRIAWYGPPMSPASFISARLMETWAHGQDVADALRIPRRATDRLRHIAHLGVRARPYSYTAHGLTPPKGELRVELVSPSGETWTWGPREADGRVTGTALDFCLVVTRRRHPADTDLVAEGRSAEEWLPIAQAYAGPPGEGRRPGQFR